MNFLIHLIKIVEINQRLLNCMKIYSAYLNEKEYAPMVYIPRQGFSDVCCVI